jgi:hypothetical protein
LYINDPLIPMAWKTLPDTEDNTEKELPEG